MNLTTDDVWDERERMGLNKYSKKPKSEYKCIDNNGVELFCAKPQRLGMLVKKHFKLTARYSKQGRWRKVLLDNKYSLVKLQLRCKAKVRFNALCTVLENAIV